MPQSSRLSALDAMFVGIETSRLHMHVGAVLVFDRGPLATSGGGIDFETLSRYLEQAMARLPNYHRRLISSPLLRHPVWVDDEHFHIRYHLRHTALPRPGTERLLKRLAGRIFSQPLNRDRPLWEIWVVEGLDNNRFALITKVHHAMVDGVGGIEVLAAMLRPNANANFTQSEVAWQPGKAPNAVSLLWEEMKYRTSGIHRLAERGVAQWKELRQGQGDEAKAMARGMLGFLRDSLKPAPQTYINPRQVGPGRRFEICRLSLSEFKLIKEKLGGKVNDVVLAVCAGALRRFLARHGDSVDELSNFRVMMPVSIHANAGEIRGGNSIAISMVELPLHLADPVERYEAILLATMNAKAGSQQVEGVVLLEEFADVTADALMRESVRLAGAVRPYNVVVTNIAGPPIPLYLLGAQLLDMFPLVPLFHQQGLGIAVVSYNGMMTFGLGADWQSVKGLHTLADDFNDSFVELLESATST